MKEEVVNGVTIYHGTKYKELWYIEHEYGFYVFHSHEEAVAAAKEKKECR